MKNKCIFRNRLIIQLILLLSLVFISCGTLKIPDDLIGTWETANSKIVVRDKVNGDFRFTKGEGIVRIIIHEDKTVSGTIGGAYFEDGELLTNWLLPTDMTGVGYTIKLELKGSIFSGDPMDEKVTELWSSPLNERKDSLEMELRYTKGMQQFPMAFLAFKKVK